MYKCLECGFIFEQPKSYSEDMTPGGAFEGGSFIFHYKGCPQCEGAYRQAVTCYACGNYECEENCEIIDKEYICEHCVEQLEEKEEV